MKCVALTMLEQAAPERSEERDAIDRRWTALLGQCGLDPIFLPNDAEAARRLLEALPLSGAVLTGGGRANGAWAQSTARDRVEREIEAWSAAHRLPIMGVCRGMQALLAWEGLAPVRLEGHVRARHRLDVDSRIVNSYHEYGFQNGVDPYRVRAHAEDGSIDGSRMPIAGAWASCGTPNGSSPSQRRMSA